MSDHLGWRKSMEYRTLGHISQEVSVIGMGGAAISGEGGGYGFGTMSTEQALLLLERALDYGINLFDTAPIYGFGLSEQRIGKAFRGKRDKVFLVSKSGVTWDIDRRVGIDNRPETTERMLEQSLRDLQSDWIDLFLIHWPDPEVDIRRPMEVLARAKEVGKIRAIGLSNTNHEDLAKASEVDRVDVLQGPFNVFHRAPITEWFGHLREQEMGWMGYGTLDKGILTGRVTRAPRSFEKTDVRAHASWWVNQDRTPKFDAIEQVEPVLKEAGVGLLHWALAFVLKHPEVSTALCGFRSLAQLDSLLEAWEQVPKVPNDVMEEVERLLQNTYFRQER